MKGLKELITINNKKYEQLNVAQQMKLDLFIQRIKEAGLEEKLLAFTNNPLDKRWYDVNSDNAPFTQEELHQTNLPKDLSNELDKIYVHLND